MHAQIVLSDSVNPYENLALEEYLCQQLPKDTFLLYLWQNDNTVVIGRNQNPYLQCNMDYICKNAVKIARRMSGGGTVYHDLGNLNYTMITNREDFCMEHNFRIVLEVLEQLHIPARRSGRNDIVAGTGKISGTAFYGNERIRYQHGCMIVNADTEKMFRCLQVNRDKISGKDIASVKARVINMNRIRPELTVEMLRDRLAVYVRQMYPVHEILEGKQFYNRKEYRRILDKYSSAEWNMGSQSEFQMVLYDRFAWGDCSIVFDIDAGYIKKAGIYTDCLETEVFGVLSEVLRGVEFNRQAVLEAFHAAAGTDPVCMDICSLIKREKQLYDSGSDTSGCHDTQEMEHV